MGDRASRKATFGQRHRLWRNSSPMSEWRVIRPGPIDTCHPMIVRYSRMHGSGQMTAADSHDCIEPRGGGRVFPRRIASFSCRRQEIRFARLPSRGLRKSDAHAGAAGGVCGGGAGDFLAHSWRLGKDGTHAYSPGGRERGCTDGCTPNGVGNCELIRTQEQAERAPMCRSAAG